MQLRFLLTPLREGRPVKTVFIRVLVNFYSRPCGRGDRMKKELNIRCFLFLLTPLREGRQPVLRLPEYRPAISTHAPAGGATTAVSESFAIMGIFLLTPLREGRPAKTCRSRATISFLLTPLREGRPCRTSTIPPAVYFYSRPCGRGDGIEVRPYKLDKTFLLTPLREGRPGRQALPRNHGKFLLTPLREGRLCFASAFASTAAFLLTPLREGRLDQTIF